MHCIHIFVGLKTVLAALYIMYRISVSLSGSSGCENPARRRRGREPTCPELRAGKGALPGGNGTDETAAPPTRGPAVRGVPGGRTLLPGAGKVYSTFFIVPFVRATNMDQISIKTHTLVHLPPLPPFAVYRGT